MRYHLKVWYTDYAMPIYEFYCPKNHKIYSFLARSLSLSDKIPRCPDNADYKLEKMPSTFAVTTYKTENEEGNDPLTGVDESKMASIMQEMEYAMAGMNENNPDPKQLSKMMRKMKDAMGGALPPAVDEMITRLEKGEDPEALEADLGNALSEEDFDLKALHKGRIPTSLLPPQRDPTLYNMSEYIEPA
ncbi:MAG: cytochrome C [Verrucomicrobiota bacterium]